MLAKYYLFKSYKMYLIKQFFVYVFLPVNENSDYLWKSLFAATPEMAIVLEMDLRH